MCTSEITYSIKLINDNSVILLDTISSSDCENSSCLLELVTPANMAKFHVEVNYSNEHWNYTGKSFISPLIGKINIQYNKHTSIRIIKSLFRNLML